MDKYSEACIEVSHKFWAGEHSFFGFGFNKPFDETKGEVNILGGG